MKLIAMYLPQFHRVKENDEWWGEGFTEWTAAKKSKPLFNGHYQPREPLNDYYYDLMDKSTMQWQADLAKKYLIGGFCFYHYWFKDGKKILEKPSENLLRWKDIDMPFCFCWANGSWVRSWSNIGNWSWSPIFDPIKEQDNDSVQAANGILLEQKYGDYADWQIHFNYLLPFFRDERYLKKDGKPIFLFYSPDSMSCLERMSLYWRTLAEKNDLPGLYLIGINMRYPSPAIDANMVLYNGGRESIGDIEQKIVGTSLSGVNYDQMWNKYLSAKGLNDICNYWCGTVDYDDTPRRGISGGLYMDFAIDKFQRYFDELMQKSLSDGNNMVFLNAWNEWGEGMYLEPDKLRGYEMLKAVATVMEKYDGIEPVKHSKGKTVGRELQWERKRGYKFFKMQELFHNWLLLKEQRKSLVDWLKAHNYLNIAVYGIGTVGKHFLTEVANTEINVKYLIDNRKGEITANIPVYDMLDDFSDCDAIIVSVVDEYWEIAQRLKEKVSCPIISLAEIVLEA